VTPPGASFEFYEGPGFRQRTKEQPALVEAIEAFVRQRYDRMEPLGADAKTGELQFGSGRFGFVVIRLGGAKLCLQQVWNAETESLDPRALEEAIKRRRKP
jgi:hypothetical protein